jgi:mannose-6-phosphate isomerase-like protein (cupin superfamily)
VDLANLGDSQAFTTKDGSTIREVAGRRTLPSQHQSLAEATVPVGGSTIPHHHVQAEELYFFTAGEGTLRIEDEVRGVKPGDCAVIPPGTVHQLVNTGDEPLVLLCCCAPSYSDEDTVLHEEG